MERENILKQEAVKPKIIFREAHVKLNLQNNDLHIEVKAQNDSILALQKSLKRNEHKH